MSFYPAVRTGSCNTLFFFTPPSGRGLVIPIFFPWFFFFFGGHLPQTSGFRSAKQILVVSFATQAMAFILSDRSIFYTPGGGRTTAGSNAPGAFLVLFSVFLVVTCPRLPSAKQMCVANFRSTLAMSSLVYDRFAKIDRYKLGNSDVKCMF